MNLFTCYGLFIMGCILATGCAYEGDWILAAIMAFAALIGYDNIKSERQKRAALANQEKE